MSNRKYENGFTLVEVLVAVLLIGLAITSLIAANISFTRANGVGTNLSTAEFLAEQIRELSALLSVVDPNTGTDVFGPEEAALTDYDDLDDFDGASFSPPINANRAALTHFAAFTQQITVQKVNNGNFEQVVPDDDPDSRFVRMTVKVFLNSDEICSTTWLRARY